ncbi:MAG TPA: M20 family metallopeptidase [Geobacteraceae bacterium]|nr:M20 family metallopeptidase [Geobacteraceae bacterium]
MNKKPDREQVLATARELTPEILGISRTLFEDPELSLQETRGAGVVCDLLAAAGFAVERGLAGMAGAFRAESGSGLPTIALIVEMDALPGLGHACGHNVIAAASTGAALILRRLLPEDVARVVVMGTPAEEVGIGKIEMIKAGCFNGIDFAMMVHPSSRRQVIKHFLGLAKIRFTFHGKPSHAAAYPEEGINALDAVIQTFNAVGALRQQLRQDVRVHGIITEGGVAPNIIPARAACYFYVRADDLKELERARERLKGCAAGAAMATGCRLETEEDPRVIAPLKILRSYYRVYSGQVARLGLSEATSSPDRNKGSSDIGNLSQLLPTIHPHVPIGEGITIHTEGFARATVSPRGEAATVEGATLLALTALELIYSPELREEILREFHEEK